MPSSVTILEPVAASSKATTWSTIALSYEMVSDTLPDLSPAVTNRRCDAAIF